MAEPPEAAALLLLPLLLPSAAAACLAVRTPRAGAMPRQQMPPCASLACCPLPTGHQVHCLGLVDTAACQDLAACPTLPQDPQAWGLQAMGQHLHRATRLLGAGLGLPAACLRFLGSGDCQGLGLMEVQQAWQAAACTRCRQVCMAIPSRQVLLLLVCWAHQTCTTTSTTPAAAACWASSITPWVVPSQ